MPTVALQVISTVTVVPATAAFGFAMLLAVIALYGRKKLAGTTLTAPCVWIAISATCLAGLALLEITQPSETIGVSALRFTVAASTLCPLVAVLGAKRPQDRGWQWIVLSLWLIVVWPAAQALAHPAGPRVELFTPWKLFLVGLVAMGPLNYLPTRHWFASLLVAGGQLVLLSDFLGVSAMNEWQLPTALGCFVIAAMTVVLRKHEQVSIDQTLANDTARWLRFRDGFGAFWAIRVMQRVNETAGVRNWPVRLTWSGFEDATDGNSSALNQVQNQEVEQTFDTLLRRFF